MTLPIEVVPNSRPLKFRWQQMVSGQSIMQEGVVPASLEGALVALIAVAKEQANEIAVLRGTACVVVVPQGPPVQVEDKTADAPPPHRAPVPQPKGKR